MPALTSIERREMRAKAHHLDPVVFIGQHGLTPAVQHEIDLALRAHELVKIRVHNDSRVERQAMLATVCEALDCAPVQHLGKLLVVWRANPDKAKASKAADARRAAAKSPRSGNKTESDPRFAPRDAATERRRRRNAQGGKAGNTTLPYFSRRGAGRFVAGTPDEAAPRGERPASRDDGPQNARPPRDVRSSSRPGSTSAPRKPKGAWAPRDAASGSGARKPKGAWEARDAESTRGPRKPAGAALGRDAAFTSSARKPKGAWGSGAGGEASKGSRGPAGKPRNDRRPSGAAPRPDGAPATPAARRGPRAQAPRTGAAAGGGKPATSRRRTRG